MNMTQANNTEQLSKTPGLHTLSAAYLLVFGRRALNAYSAERGHDLSLLLPLLVDVVGTWVDANGGNRADISAAAAALDERMLYEDYGMTPPSDAPSTMPWFSQNSITQ